MLKLEQETYRILGACFEVYKEKGCGFTEPIFQECLEIELAIQDIPFQAQAEVPLVYKGQTLQHCFRPDFVCFEQVIVEIKAVPKLAGEHRAQLLNYLHATDMSVGLLVNFGHHPKVEHERLAV